MTEPVKRICIISRAQIRYEGDFISVEYHETCGRTITLANVRSFGTENRPAEKKAPPKDVIYEKIMFTENDLVSITFVEEADIIDDPSIVIVEPPYSSNIAPIGTKPVNNQAPMSHRHGSDSWNDQKQDSLKFEEKKPARPNAWGQPTRTNSDQNQSNWNSGNSQQSNRPYHNNQMSHPNSSSHHQQAQSQHQSRNNQQVKSPRQNGPNRYNNPGQNNRGNYSGGNMRGYGNNNRGNYRNHYNTNRRNNASNNNTKENDIPITGEYDIESANKELAAELEKLEIGAGDRGESTNAGESGRDSQDEKEEEDKVVYDSTKSIFDQLSSQMLDKAMGRKTVTQSFRDERKLNSTTFGSLGGSYNDHHHRRNYNRNYGNQQNYRRGGGGGNYQRRGYRNNNNNYNSNNTNSNLVEADK